MNNDCIFNVLLYSELSNICNCLIINKTVKNISNKYFWKLLCERDYYYVINKLECNSLLEKYILFHNINKLTGVTLENYLINELLETDLIMINSHQFLKILTHPNILNVFKQLDKLQVICVIEGECKLDRIDRIDGIEHVKILYACP